MRATSIPSTGVGERAGTDRAVLAKCAVRLIGTLAFNAALLVAGIRLTGFAWQDVCLLLLPPMVASAGAGFAFMALNRMALRSEGPAALDLSALSVPQTWVNAARAS
jgi:hypothetical protein